MKLHKTTLFVLLIILIMTVSACSPSGASSDLYSSQAAPSPGTSSTVTSVPSVSDESTVSSLPERYPSAADELRGVWISYYELYDILKGKTEAQFKKKISQYFDDVKNANMNAVIVHVRPSSDAFYESEIFPWSMYVTGTQGVSPGYDPLEYMVDAAHERGLEFHAWINPYRVCQKKNLPILAESNPAKIWLTDDDKANDDNISATSGSYYYNPASEEARKLIISGVEEIVKNYSIDGIHFDDYFYPTTAADFDKSSYAAYKESATGTVMSLGDWRREQVNILVRDVYSAIKAIDPRVVFGISPAARIDYVRDELYADCALWMKQSGYLDYICPQLYFGFEHPQENVRFDALLERWATLPMHSGLKFYVGLASYKIGTKDAGSTEWIDNSDILKREILLCRNYEVYDGVVFFSHTSIFGNKSGQKAEFNNVLPLFQDGGTDE